MKIFELFTKSKTIICTQTLIFIILCGTRLTMPIANTVYINMLFSIVIFLVLPIGLWWYIEKTTKVFSSSYVQVRLLHVKTSSFFLNVVVNDLLTALFVLINACIIFTLSFDFSGTSFLARYALMVLYWLCIYLLFINLFHFVYYFTSTMKNAFFSSYIFLFLLSFTTDFISPSLFDFERFSYERIIQLILCSFIILLCAHIVLYYLGKGKRDVYDKN